MGKLIIWLPRILGLLFIFFISLFAMDAFSGTATIGDKIIAFLIHMIPSFVLTILLILGWKKPMIGAIFFAGLAIVYAVFTFGEGEWTWIASISGPLFLIGILFFLSDFKKGG